MRLTAVLCIGVLAAASSPAWGLSFDSREYVERAAELVQEGRYELARNYLEPALIDYRLSPGERSRAYYLRGFSFYDQGMYVSAAQDYNRALEFNPGNAVVLTAMAHLHANGLGVEADPKLAVSFFEQAARAEHPPAYLNLGIAYLRGMGVEQNLETAREWLHKAADADLPAAMLYLAQSYRAPLADPPDPAEAQRWYQRAADAGESDALAYLGFMAENGEAGEPDADAARDYFTRAAEAGSAVAQAKLGHLYLTGDDGVAADPAKALAWFRKAADQGHPTGFMGLAYFYDSGTVVDQDPEQAHEWYQHAAEAGMVDAQLRLAYSALGQGDLEGQTEAGAWFARAAAQDNPQALNDYAWLLATSSFDGVRNGTQAVTLALQAVERHRSPSYLDTLAAAYAETGKYDRAVATQEEALTLVPEGEAALAAELNRHLEAFQAGQPWRE